ncbi:MAG: DUF4810 domain-containing protein [Bacteroidales bacterium]|nr:DUF4810 domain-containing protein [Bacteroidales bacterium]
MKHAIPFLVILSLGVLSLFTSCKGAQPMVQDSNVQLAYLKEASEDNLEALSKAYATAINKNRKAKVKYPGLFCDYAVTLALLGNASEANKWFNNEVAEFPSSQAYVNTLKAKLIPQYANDNTTTDGDAIETDPSITEGMRKAVKNVIDEQEAKDAEVKEQGDESSLKPTTDRKKQPAKKKGKKGKKGKKRR